LTEPGFAQSAGLNELSSAPGTAMICFAFLPGRASGRAENTLTCKCDYRNYRSYMGSHDPSAKK